MNLYDCFQFFDEEHILDLRLNILDEFVNYFVIVESTTDHQGNEKKLNFDQSKFGKFKKKIIYIVVDDTSSTIKKNHLWGESLVEQHQRNSIMKGLKNCHDNDLVILSDVDEIPNLNELSKYNKNNYGVFSQKMFNYKLNLYNETESNWFGSKICMKKNIKSPQWLRNLKFKKYPFWRFDKKKNIQIIENGGWHFAYLQHSEGIIKKIKSFSHGEFNKPNITNKNSIEEKIKMKKDIFNRDLALKKVELDKTFPRYIFENKDKLKEWII